MKSILHFVWSMPLAKESIINLVLSQEFKGIDASSAYAVLLSKLSGLPLLASDYNVLNALNSINNDEFVE